MQYENNKFYYDREHDTYVLIHYHHNANLYYASYRNATSPVSIMCLLDLSNAQDMEETTYENYYSENTPTEGYIQEKLAELNNEISEITAHIRELQNKCTHKNMTYKLSHDSGESKDCICPNCDKRWREYT